MTKHLRFLIVLLLTLVWSAGWAQTTVEQTRFTATSADNINGDNNVSYSCAQGGGTVKPAINTGEIRLYKISGSNKYGGTITIKVADGYELKSASIGSSKATSIAYTLDSHTTLSKAESLSEGNVYSVTGLSANSITFYCMSSNNYISVNKLSVTYTKAGPSKAPTKVAFPKESFSFATTDNLSSFTGQSATLTSGETTLTDKIITYSKSGDDIFSSFDTTTGKLALNGNAGTATVTATFAGDDTYAKASAKYTLNVIDPNKTDVTFDFTDPSNFGYTGSTSDVIVLDEGAKLTKQDFVLENVQRGKTTTRLHEGYLKIYASDKNHPAKGKISLSAPAGCVINRIVFTDKSSSPVSNLSFSIGEIDSNSKTWTGSAKALTMEVAKNQVFIQTMTIYFVKDTETITLDETATNNNIVANTGVNVTLKRTMQAGVWNTICLPFGLTSEQITTAFGEGVKVAQLDDTNSTGATLKFVDMTNIGMEASLPYLIKPVTDAPADGYKFVGVDITKDAVIPTKVKTAGNLYFNGVYNMVDATTEVTLGYNAAFLGKNNTIFGAQSGTNMKGFRAYFAIPNSVKASELRVVIDGTATSIKNIDSEVVESNAPVYNLQGQRVDGNNLTPGIYVKAGKKFVVK